MSKKIRTEAVDQLFEAILCLKDKEECYTFFEDVCTINELHLPFLYREFSDKREVRLFLFWESVVQAEKMLRRINL